MWDAWELIWPLSHFRSLDPIFLFVQIWPIVMLHTYWKFVQNSSVLSSMRIESEQSLPPWREERGIISSVASLGAKLPKLPKWGVILYCGMISRYVVHPRTHGRTDRMAGYRASNVCPVLLVLVQFMLNENSRLGWVMGFEILRGMNVMVRPFDERPATAATNSYCTLK